MTADSSNDKRHGSGWQVKAARILIIDDDPAVCACLRRQLEDTHLVETALGALPALRFLRAGARFDVILCDVMMPGVDGLDLLEAIQREVPEQVPAVMFMGGDLDRPRRVRLHVLGKSCLDKPLDPDRLLLLIEQRVARAREARDDLGKVGEGSG